MEKRTIHIIDSNRTDFPKCGKQCSKVKDDLDFLDLIADQYTLDSVSMKNPCVFNNQLTCKIDIYRTMGIDYIM